MRLSHTLLGSAYLRVIFNLFYTLLSSVYLRVTFDLFYTLLGSLYPRVTFNLSYTLLSSVYLRVIFNVQPTNLHKNFSGAKRVMQSCQLSPQKKKAVTTNSTNNKKYLHWTFWLLSKDRGYKNNGANYIQISLRTNTGELEKISVNYVGIKGKFT